MVWWLITIWIKSKVTSQYPTRSRVVYVEILTTPSTKPKSINPTNFNSPCNSSPCTPAFLISNFPPGTNVPCNVEIKDGVKELDGIKIEIRL